LPDSTSRPAIGFSRTPIHWGVSFEMQDRGELTGDTT